MKKFIAGLIAGLLFGYSVSSVAKILVGEPIEVAKIMAEHSQEIDSATDPVEISQAYSLISIAESLDKIANEGLYTIAISRKSPTTK